VYITLTALSGLAGVPRGRQRNL